MAKKTIAVLYGGRSSEHEISIITALQAMEAIDPLVYHVMPVYISLEGKWYTGERLFDKKIYRHFESKKNEVDAIVLLPDPTIQGFLKIVKGSIDVKKVMKVDACLLLFHGQFGEDGCVQGLLEMAEIPFTGCHVAASALSMNKTLSKKIAEADDVPVVPYVQVKRSETLKCIDMVCDQIEKSFNQEYPLFVKPVHLGSSIAISKASDRKELKKALTKVFQFDTHALIETCITAILEINVSVIDQDPPIASVVEIPIATEGYLSYADKYERGGKGKGEQGMASLQRVIDPVDLDPNIKELVREYALKLYATMGIIGIARFDFIYDMQGQKLYFNEVNPLPGSLSFYLWEKSDPRILYPDMIRHLLENALKRKHEKDSLLPLVGFKALR